MCIIENVHIGVITPSEIQALIDTGNRINDYVRSLIYILLL